MLASDTVSLIDEHQERDDSRETSVVRLGCAGWSIPWPRTGEFPGAGGSHLTRYATRFSAVEINSSFQRSHRPETYARWAASVPADFRFSVKLPRPVTHKFRLLRPEEAVARFAGETGALGAKLGPWLAQLPPSLEFDANIADAFFTAARRVHTAGLACEPRHPSWFTTQADELLARHQVARVAADPAVVPEAAEPGGWRGLVYRRLHGSPKTYYSSYSNEYLRTLAQTLRRDLESATSVWCIFDNTAEGAAIDNALRMTELL
jgi:uncharacterized protein YecE (DUF72 family)